ncbi:MAG TPA: MMPL family transporter [Planctomycetota bacterium]|nr:MMPL family transporter [Planctomycetota bacterium]
MSARELGARLVLLPLARPAVTLALVATLVVVALLGWPFVKFEPDVSRLLPAHHPHVRIAELLDARARPARTLWLLLRGPDLDALVPKVAAALRASPLVAEVATTRDELFAAAVSRAQQAPLWALAPADLNALQQALSPAGRAHAIETLRQDLADDPVTARELAVRDPLGLRWLLAAADPAAKLGLEPGTQFAILADGTQALLRLTGTADAYDVDYATSLLEHVERVLAGYDCEVFGGYLVARGDQARIRADFERSSAWALALVALYLCWVMRGIRLPLLVQLPATLSIACAIPLGSAWFGPLPTVSVAAVAVLCGLGVDFAIHYAARYREERLHLAHEQAVASVQRATVPELLIDMATTAVTFLAVGSGELSGLRAFGWLLALGLLCSVLVTVTVLPILLRFAGQRRDPERSQVASLADRWMQSRSSRPVAWAVIAAAIMAAGFVAGAGVQLQADPAALRPADDPVAAARQRIETVVGFSTVPVAVLWPLAEEPGPLLHGLRAVREAGDLRFWSGLEAVDTRAGRQAVADFRASTAGFAEQTLAELARAGLEPEPFRRALEDLAARHAADPPALEPVVVDVDGVAYRVVTVWPRERLDRDGFERFAVAVRAHAGHAAVVHGAPTVMAMLEQVLRTDLRAACCWAALLAMLMVTLWLRSWRHGLLALLPSALGLTFTLLLLVALGEPLSLLSFVAVPFVLGIGVDEGVHLVGHFRCSAATTGATGVGIARTSLGTVLGFSSLLVATSPGLRAVGAIVAIGSLATMLACLFVLAPLLAQRDHLHQSRFQQNQ